MMTLISPARERFFLPARWLRKIFFGFFFVAMAHSGSAQPERSPAELRRLTLEELLQTKVISGTRTLENWKTTPAALSLISAEMIEESGATRLPEVLHFAPGLNVARYVGSSYAIGARGFGSSSSNKLQVMMDGRSLYTPLFSGVFWEVQDTLLEDLDRVEVVRGPGAALWGSNAVNGVINFVSKNAKETQGGLITGYVGNEESSSAAIRYGGKIGETTYYRTYFKTQKRDDQVLANGARAFDGMQQDQGGFRLDSTLAEINRFTLQGDVYENAFGVSGRPDAENCGGNLLGRWTHAFGSEAEVQVQAYYDHGRRDVPLQFREERETYDVELQHRFKIGAHHSFVLGGGYRNSRDETAQAGRTFVFQPANQTLEWTRFFFHDQVVLIPDRLSVSIGSTLEHNEYSGWENQPSLRLAWTVSESQFAWAGISRAVRAPTRADTDSRFLPVPASGFVLIAGTPDFKCEKALVYELGYRFQPMRNWFFDLAAFYNDYSDLRTLEPSGPTGFPLQIKNERDGSTYGAEGTVTFEPKEHWRLIGSISHLQENLRFRPGSRDATRGSVEANDPGWTAALHSAINFSRGIELDAAWRYVAALPNPAVPSYVTLDIRLAFRPTKNCEISLVGQNLLEPSHPEFSTASEVQRGYYARFSARF